MKHRSTPVALLAVLVTVAAASSWGCASSPSGTRGVQTDKQGGGGAHAGLALQTASPREVVEQHVARIEGLRARLVSDGESPVQDDGASTVDESQAGPAPSVQVDAQPRHREAAQDACEDTCLLAQEICASSETICEVAEGSAPLASRDLELVETCRWASATCDESLEVCVSCRTPVVRGE